MQYEQVEQLQEDLAEARKQADDLVVQRNVAIAERDKLKEQLKTALDNNYSLESFIRTRKELNEYGRLLQEVFS